MKVPGLKWFSTKYKFLVEDSAKKGFFRSISENIYELKNRRLFKNIGVIHPDYCINLDKTNAKSAHKDAHENQPSSFYSLNKAFRALNIKPADISLLDIGCGSGRVLSFAMKMGVKEVFGVDLDEPALEKAISNCTMMQKMGYNTSFQISHEDAADYEIPGSVNVIFLFNPFGRKTMETVVDNISRHARKQKREVYIIYSNPTCPDLFSDLSNCKKVFESYFKTRKADIAIFRLSHTTVLNTASTLFSLL